MMSSPSTLLRAVFLVVLLSAASLSVSAAPSSSLWRHVGRPSDLSVPIHLTIGVKQRNVAVLERTLTAVSVPTSPSYRRHLSFDALNRLMAPRASDPRSSHRLARGRAAFPAPSIQRSVNGEWLSVDTTLEVAESLLTTEYHTYRHTEMDVEVLRCDSYTLPESVKASIDVIGPHHSIPSLPHTQRRQLPSLSPPHPSSAQCTTRTPPTQIHARLR